MAAPKVNIENAINEILSDLDFGMDRADCLSKFVEKWRVSTRTFDRYWSEALSRFAALNIRAQNVLEQEYINGKKEALKKAILTKHERMEILTQIAKGELTFQKEVPTKFGPQMITATPDFTDRKAAIAELNKMDGEYAPSRKDITSGGEPLKQITGIVVE